VSHNLPEIDPTVPSIARVYDAFLGGKDHYEVDRQVLQEILKIAPEAQQIGRECRAWLIRVVRFMAASAGVDQFLDVGSGLPTAENTHQAVQRIKPEAQVVYVDNDPMVAAHGRGPTSSSATCANRRNCWPTRWSAGAWTGPGPSV
jgi:hypothetical protein